MKNLIKLLFNIEQNIWDEFPIGSKVRFVQGEFATHKYEGVVVSHDYIFDIIECIGVNIEVSPTHYYRNYPVTNPASIVLID